MEYVGARVYVLDSPSASLIGTVGVITAVSKNCFFLAVDAEGGSAGSTGGSVANTVNKSNNTPATVAATTAITNTTNKNINNITPTALTLVKATTTIGVVLPSLHSKHKPNTLFADDAEVVANTTANANSSNMIDSGGKSGTRGTNIATGGLSTELYGANSSAAVAVGYKFDHNEREGGGRICVLYGKHFLPHCKYE